MDLSLPGGELPDIDLDRCVSRLADCCWSHRGPGLRADALCVTGEPLWHVSSRLRVAELSRFNTAETGAFMARISASMRQMMFLTVPTCFAYLAFGLLLVRALFERGRFNFHDSCLIYVILGGVHAQAPGHYGVTPVAERLLCPARHQDTRQNRGAARGNLNTRVHTADVFSGPLCRGFLYWLSAARLTPVLRCRRPISGGNSGGVERAALAAYRAVSTDARRSALAPPDRYGRRGAVRRSAGGTGLVAAVGLASGADGGVCLRDVCGDYLALARLFRLSEMKVWAGRVRHG